MVDYWAKLGLACPVTTTQGTRDAVAALEAAIDQAETLLGHELLQDCVDHHTGELLPVVVVTDNGPAYRSVGFARFIASRPELRHVRTRHRPPQTNGVVERFYQAIKYEHLYRHEINDGLVLAREVENYLTIYNTIRPHEAISFATPISRYLQAPPPRRGPTFKRPQPSQILDAGHEQTGTPGMVPHHSEDARQEPLCSDESTGTAVNRQSEAEGWMLRRAGLAIAGLVLLALVLLLGFAVGSRSTDPDRDVRRVLREPLDERPYRMAVRLLATETGWPHASYLTALLPLVLSGAVLARDGWARRQGLRLTRWRWLLLLAAAVPMQHLLRMGFGRAGPNVLVWSGSAQGAYPSGAALVVALGWAIGVVVISDLRPRWRPVLLVAAAVALGLHAWARVAAHKHWATDILGSYLLVGSVLLLAAATRSRLA